jgi:hypothetical protein
MLIDRNDQVFTIAVVDLFFVLLGILLIHILKADVNLAYLFGVLLSVVGLFFGARVLSILKQCHQ